jgi:sulfur-carrier protein adenylyltransferase/sulfurtransferase
MSKNTRYSRQSVLPEIGPAGQDRLSRASVLCIGAGGLGCPALLYLVAAGVGRIGIVDFDAVDETNLHRQVLFTMDQIGRNKADAAKERLEHLNPGIKIESYPVELTDRNAEELFARYDIIIDGTDNFAAKFLINDTAVKTGKPFIYGSILGFNGHLAVFNAQAGPCYRCLFPEAPSGHVPTCAEAGVIGAVAGMIGATQAMEAIKLIVDHADLKPLAGKVWNINLRTMENRLLTLAKNPHCPTCSKNKKDITLQYTSPACSVIRELTPQQVRENTSALLIDVRELQEWQMGHIDNAKLMPLSLLSQGDLPDLPPDREIILHCQHGVRSLHAAQILRNHGFLNIAHMAGGYEAWLKSL